ncbi:hypothetical protein FJZ19_05485 [Candidatus Pacearchaeota archaeon]|nr:hypothetical protein [Candidatus Pacearchaeota archaeon]
MKNKAEKEKLKTEAAKISSSLMKDIARIRKQAYEQAKMNTLRKYQIKLMSDFLNKLIEEGRISKEELKNYMPKKKQAEKKLFS